MEVVKFYQLEELYTINLEHYSVVKYALTLERHGDKAACLTLEISTEEKNFKIRCAIELVQMDTKTYSEYALYLKNNKEWILEDIVLAEIYKKTLNVILAHIAELIFASKFLKASSVFYETL